MGRFVLGLAVTVLAGFTAGCGGTNSSGPAPVATAAPADPLLAGAVVGPAGSQLTTADRRVAGKAQFDAVADGNRRSWRGKTGSFGYITTGPVSSGIGGNCREYTHTIYMNGRPNIGKGKACQTSPGQWKVVS